MRLLYYLGELHRRSAYGGILSARHMPCISNKLQELGALAFNEMSSQVFVTRQCRWLITKKWIQLSVS